MDRIRRFYGIMGAVVSVFNSLNHNVYTVLLSLTIKIKIRNFAAYNLFPPPITLGYSFTEARVPANLV